LAWSDILNVPLSGSRRLRAILAGLRAILRGLRAARELRDRWLEQVNADPTLLASAGKYEVAKPLDVRPCPSTLLEGEGTRLLPAA
jgi:hypothetical protein